MKTACWKTKNQGKVIIMAVAHHQFRDMGVEAVRRLGKHGHVLYDLKYVFSTQESDLRL